MNTITQVVKSIVDSRPFLSESLSQGIINHTSLAQTMKEEIEKKLGKPVKEGSIIMALRRYNPNQAFITKTNLKKVVSTINNIMLRTDLTEYHLLNSETFMDVQINLLKYIKSNKDIFYTFNKGIYDSNFIINNSHEVAIEEYLKNETIINKVQKLNALTVKLPDKNEKIVGLYYMILKQLAWEGINLYEIVSTTNEITLIIEDHYIEKAFACIKQLAL